MIHYSLVLESFKSALSQKVGLALTATIVAGMCIATVTTTGRTVGAEEDVLRSIDSAGARTIVVRADPSAGVSPTVLSRVARLAGVQWVAAFGNAVDVHNIAIPGGLNVPVRQAWGPDLAQLGDISGLPLPGESVLASPLALRELQMVGASGAVEAANGQYAVTGTIKVPSFLSSLEPLAIVPEEAISRPANSTVSVLVVVAKSPAEVSTLSSSIVAALGATDPSKVKVSTSSDLVKLQGLVASQLNALTYATTAATFTLSGLLVAAILSGLVSLKRKDYGRRRALGASRRLIVAIVMLQTAWGAVAGVVTGCLASATVLWLLKAPAPSLGFFIAVGLLALQIALLGSLPPAILASRRDPVRELRIP